MHKTHTYSSCHVAHKTILLGKYYFTMEEMMLKEIKCSSQDHAPIKWQSQYMNASLTDSKVCSLHTAIFSMVPFFLFLSLINMLISRFLSF